MTPPTIPKSHKPSTIEHLTVELAGEAVQLDPRGVLLLDHGQTMVVADLHLEKGSAFARRGTFLPPYDTLATLVRLETIINSLRPERLISLGDGFHDSAGARLLTGEVADRLQRLAQRLEWIWIRGNHDELLPDTLPGTIRDDLTLGHLTLRHLPDRETGNLIAGHLHPIARIGDRRRKTRRPCFVHDRRLMLMPAFGSYTGGLNILDPVISGLFDTTFTPYLLGQHRLHRTRPDLLIPDPPDWRRHRI